VVTQVKKSLSNTELFNLWRFFAFETGNIRQSLDECCFLVFYLHSIAISSFGDVLCFAHFPAVQWLCTGCWCSGMSRKRGIPEKDALKNAVHESVKREPEDKLRQLLFGDLQYERADFKTMHITKMRTITEKLLTVMQIESVAALKAMKPLLRAAALMMTGYGPPHGAAVLFEVLLTTRACLVVMVCFSYSGNWN
jgi:hypothetical protein